MDEHASGASSGSRLTPIGESLRVYGRALLRVYRNRPGDLFRHRGVISR